MNHLEWQCKVGEYLRNTQTGEFYKIIYKRPYGIVLDGNYRSLAGDLTCDIPTTTNDHELFTHSKVWIDVVDNGLAKGYDLYITDGEARQIAKTGLNWLQLQVFEMTNIFDLEFKGSKNELI